MHITSWADDTLERFALIYNACTVVKIRTKHLCLLLEMDFDK